MTSVHLLATGHAGTRAQIAEGLRGNLCRCTGYSHIIDAVEHARASMPAGAAGSEVRRG